MFESSAHTVLHLVEVHGPILIAVLTAGETMGLPLPAESLLLAAGAFAGTTGKLSIYGVVAAAAAGAIVGDNIGYLIGRTVGYGALHRWGKHVGISEDRLILGHYLFERHGSKVVFFGRFVALLRALSALLAGANRMEWPRFLVSNAAGGVTWACLYGFGAYFLGNLVHRLNGWVGLALLGAAVCVLVPALLYVRRHEKEMIATAKRQTAAHARRAALLPRLGPQADGR